MLFTQKIIYFSLNSFVFPNLANKTQNIIANFRGKILFSKERVGGLFLEKYTTLIQSLKKVYENVTYIEIFHAEHFMNIQ